MRKSFPPLEWVSHGDSQGLEGGLEQNLWDSATWSSILCEPQWAWLSGQLKNPTSRQRTGKFLGIPGLAIDKECRENKTLQLVSVLVLGMSIGKQSKRCVKLYWVVGLSLETPYTRSFWKGTILGGLVRTSENSWQVKNKKQNADIYMCNLGMEDSTFLPWISPHCNSTE